MASLILLPVLGSVTWGMGLGEWEALLPLWACVCESEFNGLGFHQQPNHGSSKTNNAIWSAWEIGKPSCLQFSSWRQTKKHQRELACIGHGRNGDEHREHKRKPNRWTTRTTIVSLDGSWSCPGNASGSRINHSLTCPDGRQTTFEEAFSKKKKKNRYYLTKSGTSSVIPRSTRNLVRSGSLCLLI